jgi:hypothetical protein
MSHTNFAKNRMKKFTKENCINCENLIDCGKGIDRMYKNCEKFRIMMKEI